MWVVKKYEGYRILMTEKAVYEHLNSSPNSPAFKIDLDDPIDNMNFIRKFEKERDDKKLCILRDRNLNICLNSLTDKENNFFTFFEEYQELTKSLIGVEKSYRDSLIRYVENNEMTASKIRYIFNQYKKHILNVSSTIEWYKCVLRCYNYKHMKSYKYDTIDRDKKFRFLDAKEELELEKSNSA